MYTNTAVFHVWRASLCFLRVLIYTFASVCDCLYAAPNQASFPFSFVIYENIEKSISDSGLKNEQKQFSMISSFNYDDSSE